jgi:hypothetical protein
LAIVAIGLTVLYACADPDEEHTEQTSEAASATLDCTKLGIGGQPLQLGCTGLYGSWPTHAIAPNVVPYEPAYHLWSDGAEKSRYISLPPGMPIDTSNMDEWAYPVGTKVWKEFRLAGKPVETRYMVKLPDGSWFRTSYAWSADGSDARDLPGGMLLPNPADPAKKAMYEIPARDACERCHLGRIDNVLGFEAIALAAPGSTVKGVAPGPTLAGIRGMLTATPRSPLIIPGDATAQAALGWLHANCGISCHSTSDSANANPTGLHMRLTAAGLGSVAATDTMKTAFNQGSRIFNPPGPDAQAGVPTILLKAGDPEGSVIPYRDGRRDPMPLQDPTVQMPPIATHLVDTAGVASVRTWIKELH